MKIVGNGKALVPPLLAFALLCAQVAIPWTVSWFATEDGPSHVYSAVVASNLILHHGHTHYSSVYRINRRIMPNWTATILLAIIEQTAGVDSAEKVMASLCICVGFFAFAYAVRCFAPGANCWSPLSNFLMQTWFLWVGFYNFYLSMLLAWQLLVITCAMTGCSRCAAEQCWERGWCWYFSRSFWAQLSRLPRWDLWRSGFTRSCRAPFERERARDGGRWEGFRGRCCRRCCSRWSSQFRHNRWTRRKTTGWERC